MSQVYKQLPQEKVTKSSWQEILTFAITVCGFVALANLATIYLLHKHTINRGYWLVTKKWELLLQLQEPVDWLILGDSSANQGIVPDLLERRLGGRAFNLSTQGDLLTIDNAWMLETYIHKHGPPKHVLIVHAYDVWHRQTSPATLAYLARIPLKWGYWQYLEPKLKLSLREQKQILQTKYVPLYSQNYTLTNLVQNPVGYFQVIRDFALTEDGFMKQLEANPQKVQLDTQKHQQFIRENEFELSVENRRSLERVAELAQEYRFHVYVANAAVHQKLYQDVYFQKYLAQVEEMLLEFVASSDRLHYLPQKMTFSDTQMQNSDHLTYAAAWQFTDALAIAIASKNSSTLNKSQ
jgi:hypothetical protein